MLLDSARDFVAYMMRQLTLNIRYNSSILGSANFEGDKEERNANNISNVSLQYIQP